jgi:hypothetical protein
MTNNYFENIIIISIASSIAEICTLPICTVRTNYINLSKSDPNKTIKQIIKTAYINHGIRWFYSSKFSAIGGQVLSTTSKYTLYNYLSTNNPIKSDKYLHNVTNGIIVNILTSLITHPLDYIKINKQMGCIVNNFNPFIYKTYGPNLSKAILSGAVCFPIYDLTKYYTNDSIISGLSSAVISTAVIQPLDYLKIRRIYGLKFDNIGNLYTGYTLYLIKIVPCFMITMIMTEKIKQMLNLTVNVK